MTSFISTTIRDVEDIRIDPIPTKPINVVKAVRQDRTTVFLDDKGRVYSTSIYNGFYFSKSNWNSYATTFQCLVKLGVISKADAAEHERECRDIAAMHEKAIAADYFTKNAKTLGIKLTAAQERRVQTARGQR